LGKSKIIDGAPDRFRKIEIVEGEIAEQR